MHWEINYSAKKQFTKNILPYTSPLKKIRGSKSIGIFTLSFYAGTSDLTKNYIEKQPRWRSFSGWYFLYTKILRKKCVGKLIHVPNKQLFFCELLDWWGHLYQVTVLIKVQFLVYRINILFQTLIYP